MVKKPQYFTLVIIFIVLFCLQFTDVSNYYTHLSSFANLILLVAAIKVPPHDYTGKHAQFKKSCNKNNGSEISLFKGREAKLNRVILLILFQDSPLVVYDITKLVRKARGFRSARYTNINRRVRLLAQQGYLEVVGCRKTQSGIPGILYQPTIRAKTAFFLKAVSVNEFIKEASDEALTTEIAAIALFFAEKVRQE